MMLSREAANRVAEGIVTQLRTDGVIDDEPAWLIKAMSLEIYKAVNDELLEEHQATQRKIDAISVTIKEIRGMLFRIA